MNTEVYDTYTLSVSHVADTMPSGLTLYTEVIANAEIAYTLTLADGQGLTWTRDNDHDWTWTDRIINNAVRNETDLTRLGQLLNMYGIESHWCNHVATPPTVKETTMNVVVPTEADKEFHKLPTHMYVIKESPLGLTWVHTYTRTDRVRATDHDAAMKLIEDMERAEQK